ncbi:MAG: copper chaperone PCu(A)C [Granulosicoccus sp.]
MRPIRLLAATILLCFSTVSLAEMPQISDARIVQPPPGAKVAAAYFTINNPTSKDLTLTGVSAGDSIKMAELHKSSVVNDVARMEKQESISIPAGESLEFKHGSYHVMLMGLSSPLEPGTKLTLELETSAGALSVAIPIITPDEASKKHTQHDDHMTMDKKMEHGDHAMDAKKTMDHK